VPSFFRKLFDKFSSPRGPAPRELFLAAFGKHPGWDDHVEIGLETERLTVVKRLLYVDGIGGNIESGVWDKLKENQRLAGFNHIFVWRAEDNLVVGRMWSSQDGKGRGRYPMVVCAQSGMSLPWMVKTVLPALERVEHACIETTSAPAVGEVLERARNDLRSDAATARTLVGARASKLRSPTSASERRELGDGEGGGLPIVLYHLERELGAGDLPLQPRAPRVPAIRTAHLRVPALVNHPARGAVPWINFLLNFVTDETPILALVPNDGSWIDLIVGEPTAAQFYCLLASLAAIPLTTEIPYQLDESFLRRARTFVAQRRPSSESNPAITGGGRSK
jgi:hypothetical protein